MSETPGLIYKKISQVMADIGAIGKNRTNPQQNFKFRGIEDLYNAAHPVMAVHGVFCAPSVLDIQHELRETRSGGTQTWILMRVQHRFFCEDGSFVDVVTTGEGLDSSDKSANKCLSAAFKYALMELFCIPMADVADSDRETPEGGTPKTGIPEAVTFKRNSEAAVQVRGPETPQAPEAPAQPVTQKRTRAPKVVANGDEYIGLDKQDWLRMKFKEALPLKYQGGGFPESTRHGWLQTNGYMDAEGVGTSKVIKVKDFKSVYERMIAFAKNMETLDDRSPGPVEIDNSDIPF